ncbi:MAG TPA: hypothetical protein VMV95_00555 [Bacillota bacterium]|nr:hypothetical protein [Bacillota bacterium]
MVGKKVVEKKVKPQKVKCFYCKNPIFVMDKQINLKTIKNGVIIQDENWHFDCWQEWFNKNVTKKAQQNISAIRTKVSGLLDNPMIRGMLSQVKGTDNLFNMLNMPLGESDIEKVKEKIQDDRNRKPEKRKKK